MKKKLELRLVFSVLTGLCWSVATVLLCIFAFSVYPNYILSGHHGPFFMKTKGFADQAVRAATHLGGAAPIENGKKASIISISDQHSKPELIDQSLMEFQYPVFPSPEWNGKYYDEPKGPVVFHAAMVPDPFTTYAPAPGDINGVVYHNKQQFRYPADLEKKKKGEFRVFITGGSTAWGANASGGGFTIGGFLEKKLRARFPTHDIKVITAAAGAWNSTQERAWILNRITEYEPDLIIAYSGHNDIVDACIRGESLFTQYWKDGAYYFWAIKNYEFYNRGSAVSSLLGRRLTDSTEKADCPRMTFKNIQIVNSYLKSINVPYAYVLQVFRKDRPKSVEELVEKFRNELPAFAKKEGFTFIDHAGLLNERQNLFFDLCHVGDVGNDLIASDLFKRFDWNALILSHQNSKN